MTTLRIAGGRVVTPEGVLDGADVLVEDGRVVSVGGSGAGAQELDARGCYVLPGGFDPHAHVYEGIGEAPAAALRSGTTAVEAYAPPEPGERVEDACARWRALATGSACRIEPLATVYEPRALDEASFAALAAQGVRGIKLFLAYRELGMDADDEVLMRALLWGRDHGVVPRLHCENAGAIQVLRERLRAAGDLGVEAHPRSRPPLVEEEGIRRALDLARLAERSGLRRARLHGGRRGRDPPGTRRGARRHGRDLPAVPPARRRRVRRAEGRDGRDLAAPASARPCRGRLGRACSTAPSAPSARTIRTAARARRPRSTSSSPEGREWRRACR